MCQQIDTLLQVLDHVQLPAVDPAGEEVQQQSLASLTVSGPDAHYARVTRARQGVVHGGHSSR